MIEKQTLTVHVCSKGKNQLILIYLFIFYSFIYAAEIPRCPSWDSRARNNANK